MSPTDLDKEELLAKRAAAGDRKAYRSIYDLHVKSLYAVCARYIACDEDAKDVIQDSFLKIFASIGSFEYRGAGSLRSWMTRIVVNEALKSIKLKGRLEFTDLDSAGEQADTFESTGDISADIIFRLIRELPDGYRTIFNLYVIEHRT
ncbi:MAG: sigma-70 family RNA polymerase sigma factor, partial [Paramuribaculum sp.]|nr:sigma-70 family RNA polymerase sigma factor [Paramuribaculum sp.]